jgi:predicted SnoaL-like aldol condensation-catalyzing enzyme
LTNGGKVPYNFSTGVIVPIIADGPPERSPMTQAPSPRERFDRFVAAASATSQAAPSARAAANESLVRRYYEMWNTGDASVATALLCAAYLDHAHPETLGPAAFRSLVPRYRAANPDARMRIEIAASDDELVAVRNTISRTHDGAPVESHGVALFRVESGKLAEQWSCYPDAETEADRSEVSPPPSREVWLSFRA